MYAVMFANMYPPTTSRVALLSMSVAVLITDYKGVTTDTPEQTGQGVLDRAHRLLVWKMCWTRIKSQQIIQKYL